MARLASIRQGAAVDIEHVTLLDGDLGRQNFVGRHRGILGRLLEVLSHGFDLGYREVRSGDRAVNVDPFVRFICAVGCTIESVVEGADGFPIG